MEGLGQAWWYTPVIPDTREAWVGGSWSEVSSQAIKTNKIKGGHGSSGRRSEFKSQYHHPPKKEWLGF
jgi:hypothetical protein